MCPHTHTHTHTHALDTALNVQARMSMMCIYVFVCPTESSRIYLVELALIKTQIPFPLTQPLTHLHIKYIQERERGYVSSQMDSEEQSLIEHIHHFIHISIPWYRSKETREYHINCKCRIYDSLFIKTTTTSTTTPLKAVILSSSCPLN